MAMPKKQPGEVYQTGEYERKYDIPQPKETLHTSDSGATSSHESLRYDLIPRQLLYYAAERYTLGVKIHGERGYQRGFADREFILDRINHIQEHFQKMLHPDQRLYGKEEDIEETITVAGVRANIGAILWGLGFLLELCDHEEGKNTLLSIISEGRVR